MDIDTKLLQSMASKFSVLLVEDDEDILLGTAEILNSLFKEVHTATNGKDGLETYLSYQKENNRYFDLIISDIMMPKMSGIDMAKKIVLLNENQQFVFISAHQNSDYLINLIDIGVSSFISKPIALATLKTVLYKNCLQLEGESIQKSLLDKIIEENNKLKEEIIALKGNL